MCETRKEELEGKLEMQQGEIGRRLNTEITTDNGKEVQEEEKERKKVAAADDDDDECDDLDVPWWMNVTESMASILFLIAICAVCFFAGYCVKPSSSENYNHGYTDAIKDIVYLEKYGYDKETKTVVNEIAKTFYNYGAVDGSCAGSLIYEIILNEDIPEETKDYLFNKFKDIFNKDRINMNDLTVLIDELEQILNAQTL